MYDHEITSPEMTISNDKPHPTLTCRRGRLMGLARTAIFFFTVIGMISFVIIHVYGDSSVTSSLRGHNGHFPFSGRHFYENQLHRIQSVKAASFARRDSISGESHRIIISPGQEPAASSPKSAISNDPLVYHVTSYGADPTGKLDSTDSILRAIWDALDGPRNGFLYEGIANLGGARVDLDGGNYLISRSIRFPVSGRGNLVIHGGSLTASNTFPNDGYLIDLSSSPSSIPADSSNTTTASSSEYNYEFITFRDLTLNSNYRGGAIRIVNSLRTSIDNCYITGFNTTGISVQGGHETYIRYTYLGQHITAGGDPNERRFSGTAISLDGNDNSVSEVVIFSASVGILISGEANTISGVHCYNKATGFGGTGIYLKTPGLTQTRIINSYMDYTGIVAEDPVQLTVSNSFFLGDAFVLLRSVNGVVSGVNIVDNMFAGSNRGVEIVQLDQRNKPFDRIDQVVIDKNNVRGMSLKSTVARGGATGSGSSWTVDFNSVLVFPNLIKQVQYAFVADSNDVFPVHALRNVSDNRVVVQSNVAVNASVYVTAYQGGAFF